LITEDVIIIERRRGKEKGTKIKLTLSEILIDSLVVFASRSLMAYSDHQTDERGGQNLRENVEEREKKTFREMVVLLK